VTRCPSFVATTPAAPTANTIAIGRTGSTANAGEGSNAADVAILAMIDAAKEHIQLSQQDLLGPKGLFLWGDLAKALARAVDRGVQVDVVLTAKGSSPGGNQSAGYGNATAAATMKALLDAIGPKACGAVHVAPYGGLNADSTPVANHAKVIIVDDRTMYVGSQNLYPGAGSAYGFLAEYGHIVDDPVAVRQFQEEFWDPAYHRARANTIVAPACGPSANGPTDCGDKADGWWCQHDAPDAMVLCEGRQISYGFVCAGCIPGQRATCPGP
jgi:phosphatidylserine/phosphatidylglycerophosphate/cardiolipin synthase-like enzyme